MNSNYGIFSIYGNYAHRERRKGQGGIPAGGDFRKEIQPEPLELFSRKTLAQRRGKRLLSPPA